MSYADVDGIKLYDEIHRAGRPLASRTEGSTA
jgi:hypothetical protein